MSDKNELPQLTPERFRGLAHPLRLRMLLMLRADGPSTATLLGKRLGESSGATSYHLRQLAEHAFVEPDDRPQHGRERWWRATTLVHRVDEERISEDRELSDVVDVYLRELLSVQEALLGEWLAQRHEFSPEWRATAVTSNYFLRLPLADAQGLVDELEKTIVRYRKRAARKRDAKSFVVQLHAFPRKSPPGEA